MKPRRLRAALAATTALVSIAIADVGPAVALSPSPPVSAVFVILPGATATAATVAMQMPGGTPIPVGVLNPTTGTFTPSGLTAEQARAVAAEAKALQTANAFSEIAAAGTQATARANLGLGTAATAALGAPNGAASLDANGKALPAQLPIGTAGGVTGLDASGTAIPPAGLGSPPASVGQATGTGNLPLTAVWTNILGWDGSTQFRFGTVHGAVEFWHGQGGQAGNGSTLRTDSDTSANVNGVLSMKGGGLLSIVNDYGPLLQVSGVGTTSANYWNISPSVSGKGLYLKPAAGSTDTTINVGIVPLGYGYLNASVPDGTNAGGNSPGQYAVDFCNMGGSRSTQYQVSSGYASGCVGGQNNSVGGALAGGVGGYGMSVNGNFSAYVGGQNGSDFSRYGTFIQSFGYFSYAGDAEITTTALKGKSTTASGVRLLSNGTTATNANNTANCINQPAGSAHITAVDLQMTGRDVTTTAHEVVWSNKAYLARDANGTMRLAQGTATTLSATSDTVTVSLTADTTNACLNVTVTPGTLTGDTWQYVMSVRGTEG